MKEFEKAKKIYNILAILLLVLASLALVAGICLEFFAEMDNDVLVICFVVALGLLVLVIPFIILIARFQTKLAKTIVDKINKKLEMDYIYQGGAPILDIVEDSMHPLTTQTKAFSKDSIIGKIEDISFEYYLCSLQEDSFFAKERMFELYVFKNVTVFPKDFFVTAKKVNDVEQYKVIRTNGLATIYTIKDEEIPSDDLPKFVTFLSVRKNTLYVYKNTRRKKLLFQLVDDMEEFKRVFEMEIVKIKHTYEETKAWTK